MLIQHARCDLGLPPLLGGAVSDQLQRRTRGTVLYERNDRATHYEPRGTRLIPEITLGNNWRFLNAPSHAEIRLVAREGHLAADPTPTFTTRGSHLPSLTVLSGPMADVQRQVEAYYRIKRGLYVLRKNGKNYVGQTKEFGTRGRIHGATGADFVLFAFPDEQQMVCSDALSVAESFVIISLGEILKLQNGNLGHDALPQTHELREGAALALAFMAALTRWAHEHQGSGDDFLCWRTDVQGLQAAYLSLNAYTAQP